MREFIKELDLLKKLVVKDIIFNIKGFSISILFSIFVYTLIGFDDNPNYSIAIYMSLMIFFTNFIAKSCLIDERDFVYDYLKTLPLKKSYIVLGKYIEGIGTIFVSYITFLIYKVIGIFVKIPKFKISFNLIIVIVAVYILYFSLYLALFFKYNYSMAQNTMFILFIGMLVVFKFFNNIKTISFNIEYILLIISFMCLYVSYRISKDGFINKNSGDIKKYSFFKFKTF